MLLIGGVLTFIGVLQEAGTVDYVGNAVAGLGMPLLVALLLCYIGAIVSAFASSTAILGATIPLAVPFLLAGEVGAVGVIVALAISSTIVDVSPFSTNGALVLANAPERRSRPLLQADPEVQRARRGHRATRGLGDARGARLAVDGQSSPRPSEWATAAALFAPGPSSTSATAHIAGA